jgi:anaerobic magnesium-protoporphyrin IX monomethyl ester cyclase
MATCELVVVHPGAAHGIYGALGDELTAIEPPLWCRLIAAYVRDRGYKVKILDLEANPPADVGQKIKDLDPTLVCIAVYGHQPSASTQQMYGARLVAEAIKAKSDVMIIMCGGHVAALPERTLKEESSIDYVCTGEGPETVHQLLRYSLGEVKSTSSVPGLMWRSNDHVHSSVSAPLLDMKELHGDCWDLLPMKMYRAHNWQCLDFYTKRQPYAAIATSLDCPFRCPFCCISAPFGEAHKYRTRDPDTVANEIAYLYYEYGVRTFKIIDEMFILNSKHYGAIAHNIIRRGINNDINIWAYARVDTVKPETLNLLRRAGFKWLALGIESGSQFVRDGASKGFSDGDIVDVVRAIQAADINVIGNYIFGLPDDDAASMQATLDLALRARTEWANFYVAMAYPGSPLYRQALERGWTLPTEWRGFSQHNRYCRPLDTLHIGAASVLRFRDNAFRTYFSDPDYRVYVDKRFGPQAIENIDLMLKYQLERDLLKEAA